jgi:hypothetical protein
MKREKAAVRDDFAGIGGVEIIKAESGQTHGISETLTA